MEGPSAYSGATPASFPDWSGSELFHGVSKETRDMINYNKRVYEDIKKQEDDRKEIETQLRAEQMVRSWGEVSKLRSDYLNMTTYYYNAEQDKIYGIEYCSGKEMPVSESENCRLRKMNNLKM